MSKAEVGPPGSELYEGDLPPVPAAVTLALHAWPELGRTVMIEADDLLLADAGGLPQEVVYCWDDFA